MCLDDKSFFERDKQKLAPLLEKWGVEASLEKEQFDKNRNAEFTASCMNRPRIG